MKSPPDPSRRPLPPEGTTTPIPPHRIATSTDKAHGRIEKRTLKTTTILTLTQKWPGLKQGFELRRERTIRGKKTVEVVYGITSLSEEEADAERLLVFVRDHWRIENQLHYVRDVTFGEDACRVRKGSSPQVLAGIRNALIHLLAGIETAFRPEAIEELQTHPNNAHDLIGIPQCQ